MKIKTASGVDLPQLPNRAWCEISGISPEKMEKCPLMNFDDRGAFCVPELCEYYRPYDGKEEEEHGKDR